MDELLQFESFRFSSIWSDHIDIEKCSGDELLQSLEQWKQCGLRAYMYMRVMCCNIYQQTVKFESFHFSSIWSDHIDITKFQEMSYCSHCNSENSVKRV